MSACPKCGGSGWFRYDHNHCARCPECCAHDAGWWELTESYAGFRSGADNACCRKGCGQLRRNLRAQRISPVPSTTPSCNTQ